MTLPKKNIYFLTCFLLLYQSVSSAQEKAPKFTHIKASEWLNSSPLKLASLQGKVILIDVWTFGCWNCYRSFPWVKKLEKKLAGEKFQVIGVHTPEFDHEKVKSNVLKKVRSFDLHHPIMLDNDFSYWHALKNRYWPAFYLIDKKGNIRGSFVGETHVNTSQAKNIESLIKKLLAE